MQEVPDRFSKVTHKLYRGGQPSKEQFKNLVKNYDIKAIVCLRRGFRMREQEWCHNYGIDFYHFPFLGVFDLKNDFYDKILNLIDNYKRGNIFVHCKNGRDRTSLIVCMYLTCFLGMRKDKVWKDYCLEFGHQQNKFMYKNFKKEYCRYIHYKLGMGSLKIKL